MAASSSSSLMKPTRPVTSAKPESGRPAVVSGKRRRAREGHMMLVDYFKTP